MHPNAALIQRFYDAFQSRDAAAMAACYHPDVRFSDPVFQELRGPEAGEMWAMLCKRATDLALTVDRVGADEVSGRAHWEARYTFKLTGRKVLNRIDADFTFAEGLIVRHTDHFDFWRWARMAFGPRGLFLGWTPVFRNEVRRQSRQALATFREGRPSTRS